MANRFHDKTMRKHYDIAVQMFATKHRDLIRPDGSRCDGNSFASAFWKGYDHIDSRYTDVASRQMLAYAFYCAGYDIAEFLNQTTPLYRKGGIMDKILSSKPGEPK
jgi:hypothetical protein